MTSAGDCPVIKFVCCEANLYIQYMQFRVAK